MNYKVSVLIAMFAVISLACDKQDDIQPEITIHELGHENSKLVKAGAELHVDVEVLAQNKIDWVRIQIHAEEHKSFSFKINDGWEFDSTYTEFTGLKNAEFHKHLHISDEALAGAYHFHFSLSDLEGNYAFVEDELTVTK
jgi:hypothetical protein